MLFTMCIIFRCALFSGGVFIICQCVLFPGGVFFSQTPVSHYVSGNREADAILYYNMLYYTILHHVIIYYIILCYSILCYSILVYETIYHSISLRLRPP